MSPTGDHPGLILYLVGLLSGRANRVKNDGGTTPQTPNPHTHTHTTHPMHTMGSELLETSHTPCTPCITENPQGSELLETYKFGRANRIPEPWNPGTLCRFRIPGFQGSETLELWKTETLETLASAARVAGIQGYRVCGTLEP